MEDIKGIIENEIRLQGLQRERFTKNLKGLPTGQLVMKSKYYYKRETRNGITTETYIPQGNQQLIEQLKTRAYMEKAIITIDSNLLAMRAFLKKYRNFDPLAIQEKLGKAYEMLPEKAYSLCGIHSEKYWNEEDYLSNPYHGEFLTMTTIKGGKVRSKSELDIANQLYLNGINYRYECECVIDATVFFPDFAVLSAKDFRVYYWEHFGLTANEGYMAKADEKLTSYREHGIVPWKNLIVTYDDANGNLDSKIISNIIDVFFKP
ncbi:hypothetical protein M2140_001745 [Clostridiales Family XIII bacterium PM5-7]